MTFEVWNEAFQGIPAAKPSLRHTPAQTTNRGAKYKKKTQKTPNRFLSLHIKGNNNALFFFKTTPAFFSKSVLCPSDHNKSSLHLQQSFEMGHECLFRNKLEAGSRPLWWLHIRFGCQSMGRWVGGRERERGRAWVQLNWYEALDQGRMALRSTVPSPPQPLRFPPFNVNRCFVVVLLLLQLLQACKSVKNQKIKSQKFLIF